LEPSKNKAVFIDRDGTLNVEKNYVHKISDFEFIAGAPEAVRLLNENGFKVIVISNQSGIARGYYTPNDVHLLHDHIQRELRKEKAYIDAFFYCPHHPEGTVEEFRKACDCRKPNPGMIHQAEKKFDLDLSRSFIIGDHLSDVRLKERVPFSMILVRTGHGKKTTEQLTGESVNPDYIEENLLEAVKKIIHISAVTS
jgi:D-glycero-D-manno-heptose 1,7-bisphosphate phosphatase